MHNNDMLRSLRYLLKVRDAKLAEIIQLAGYEISAAEVTDLLKSEDEAGYQLCEDELLAQTLNGIVFWKRGKDPNRPQPPLELPVSNNTVLKKLRVAFELKDEDIQAILAEAGFEVSKSELSALFRKPEHKHFRPCGDQFLRYFLKGLSLRVRA